MPDKDDSHRSLADRLGLKPGQAVRVVGRGDPEVLAQARERIAGDFLKRGNRSPADVILYWPRTAREISPTLAELRQSIAPTGAIWVITAKRGRVSASDMPYLNQDDLIPLGALAGLVDNKVCSVSEAESGMRFVIRRKDRR